MVIPKNRWVAFLRSRAPMAQRLSRLARRTTSKSSRRQMNPRPTKMYQMMQRSKSAIFARRGARVGRDGVLRATTALLVGARHQPTAIPILVEWRHATRQTRCAEWTLAAPWMLRNSTRSMLGVWSAAGALPRLTRTGWSATWSDGTSCRSLRSGDHLYRRGTPLVAWPDVSGQVAFSGYRDRLRCVQLQRPGGGTLTPISTLVAP